MKITICDRCNCVIKDNDSVMVTIDNTMSYEQNNDIIKKEICQDCYKILIDAIRPIQKNDILDKNIVALELSVRSTNLLLRNGIKTIGELMKMTRREMKSISGIGNKCIREIELAIDDIKKEMNNIN